MSGSMPAKRRAESAEETAIVANRPLTRESSRRLRSRLGPAAATRIGTFVGRAVQARSMSMKEAQALASQLRPEDFTVAVEDASLSSESLTAFLAERATSGKAREAGSHSSTATPETASSSKAASRKDSRRCPTPDATTCP